MHPKIKIAEDLSPSSLARKNCSLFTVDFFGTPISVTVTSNSAVVRKWLRKTVYLSRKFYYFGRLIVGAGVQWSPPSKGNDDPPADTLQLCVGTRCLIIQLSHADRLPRYLHRFLADAKNTFVGLWNASDDSKLKITKHSLSFGKILDLRMYTGDLEMQVAPVERIVLDVLLREEVRLDQRVDRGRWDQRILNSEQVLHAAVDSLVCFQIGEALRVWEISKSDIKVKSDLELMMEAGVPELEDLYGYYV